MSYLILGRGPAPRPTTEIFIKMPSPLFQGIIGWELTRKGIIISQGEMKNLITDAGLDGLATFGTPALTAFCGVGTSSTAPANNQTDLIAPVTRVSRTTTGDVTITSGPSFDYWSIKRVHLFLEAEGNGNLTEVGYFRQATADIMFSRQLFKDTLGVPTTVVKTSSDQLKITYELRCYTPQTDVVQSGVVISGTSYTFTTRAREIDSNLVWGAALSGPNVVGGMLSSLANGFNSVGGRALESSTLGARDSSIGGTAVARDSATVAAYTSGNFFRDVTSKWEPTTANFATGIGGIHNFGGDTTEGFQISVSPKFAKDATKRLTFGTRWSWGRFP
jgi:hypothetical protein